jgi:hypothetical protein
MIENQRGVVAQAECEKDAGATRLPRERRVAIILASL